MHKHEKQSWSKIDFKDTKIKSFLKRIVWDKLIVCFNGLNANWNIRFILFDGSTDKSTMKYDSLRKVFI